MRQKSLYFDCHSGLDPESSIFEMDSRSPIKDFEDKLRGNDGLEINVKKPTLILFLLILIQDKNDCELS